ncbi:MAG TPA: VWA domain-containing protein [Candidatus Wallbacteria bacterium]|nr:VWA domain-containing protein [Candidatus Wallbacteria bacterium]
MSKIKAIVYNMSPAEKFFNALGLLSLFGWLFINGFFIFPGDDWSYLSLNDPSAWIFYFIFIFPAIPYFYRQFIRPALKLTLLRVFLYLAIIGIMLVLAVPNFNRARMQGFSAGGAKDIQNFRMNIQRDYLPLETDITYEGLFYDYYFDIQGDAAATKQVALEKPSYFKPVYSWSSSKNVLNGETENFITIGLRSDMDLSKIKRKKLNIVVVLDISGSMSSRFNSYYYDQVNEKEAQAMQNDPDVTMSKLNIAARSICSLLDHMKPEDCFGMVLFDQSSYLAKPLGKMSRTNLNSLKKHILAIKPQGGTNMEIGYGHGRSLLNGCETLDPDEFENRIIFLTDAMPNTGNISQNYLLNLAKEFSDKRIYSTFIGIGVDFQTALIEGITKVRGANYYSIHSSWEFKKRMAEEFDYMVNPLLFNLNLSFASERWTIEEVYGSPEASLATGELMKVNTLFPAPLSNEGVKGGVIVLKLRDRGGSGPIKLSTSYELRSGSVETGAVEFTPGPKETPGEKDARKAVLLSRYVRLMKEWIKNERAGLNSSALKNQQPGYVSDWERKSVALSVSDKYYGMISRFANHFKDEAKIINDPDLKREETVFDFLAK